MKKFITFIIAIFDLMGSAMIADIETPAEKSDRLCGIDRIQEGKAMQTLIEFIEHCKELMLKYPDSRPIRKSFYMQAFGACSYEALRQIKEGESVGQEAEALWAKYEPELDAILNAEG